MSGIFAKWAPIYWAAGYNPLPISPNQKACHLNGWQEPMNEGRFDEVLRTHGHYGIGILMGTPSGDGTTLLALDIDHDSYTPIAKVVMGHPPAMRKGKKGVGIICRVRGIPHKSEFRFGGELGQKFKKHAELLGRHRLLVIPPTIHPETGQPYVWLGKPLHEIPFDQLPIIEV